jgi:hypothetical protein
VVLVHPGADERIVRWLTGFRLDGCLHGHVARVLASMPESVRADLLGDPAFLLSDYEPVTGLAQPVLVRMTGAGGAGRSVVLKRTLRRRPEPFVRYVIAHEFAHAYLRNEGRFPGDDPEHAADALAAEWGFPRPAL